jgi:hypothetical protein
MTERWDVETSDAGAIAVWVDGKGPPLVLVHGSIRNQAGFAPLIRELGGEVTTGREHPAERRCTATPQFFSSAC